MKPIKLLLFYFFLIIPILSTAEEIALSCGYPTYQSKHTFLVLVDTVKKTVQERGRSGMMVEITDMAITYFVYNIPNRDNRMWKHEINRYTGTLITYDEDGNVASIPGTCQKTKKSF